MTDAKKLQIPVVVDGSDAKAGFAQVKDAAKDMATSVAQSGKEAAKGVDGIGAGADASARAYGRFEAEIRRKSASIKASLEGTGAAGEIANKAMAQGLDASRLEASLQGLRELERQAKATAAAARSIASAPAPALTTSLGASNFVKPLGNPTTSLGATAFGSVAAESQKAAAVATQSLGKIGVSAAQTANALRGVPAQFTDIVTSLQGGQAPLTVLLQQGGQLKDMFGGIGPAAKALGGYVLGLVNPFTVAAAAVATLGVAYHQGAKESEEYNKSLILTGNYLGLTVSQMQVYAKTISATVGTQGAAAEALTSLANSGKVAKESLTSVGTAVVYMNRVLGQSVDEATATFVKLADEPTKASAKLNESMHYLNLATYERIRALEDQGNKEAAAALAQKTLADETTARLQKVEAGAGSLERGWRSLADGAKAAWDAMLGIGRTKSIGDALGEAQAKLTEARAQVAKGGAYASLYGPSVKKGEQDVAALSRSALNAQEKAIAEGEKARTDAAQIGSAQRLTILANEIKTNKDKREKAIADIKKDFAELGTEKAMKAANGKTEAQLIAAAEEKFKDSAEKKGPREKAYQDDAATRMLEGLRQQEAALKEQLSTDEKLTASEKERAKFVQLVTDLKTKGTLTADQKSLLANQSALLAQHDANVELDKQVEAKKESARLDKEAADRAKSLANTLEGITISMESANQGRRDQYNRVLATVGLGERARAEVAAQQAVREEARRAEAAATKQASKLTDRNGVSLLQSKEYKDAIESIHESEQQGLRDLEDYYARDKLAREDWVNGAKQAFANYADEASNAAKHTEEAFTNAFKGLEDQLTNFLTGGKFDIKGLLKQVQGDLTRNAVKEGITGPLASLANDFLGSDTGGMLAGLLGGGKSKGALAGGGAPRGSSTTNPLYVKSVDAGFGAAANDSKGGGGILGALGNLFGGGGSMSNSAATAAANAMPGDALDALINLQGGWGTMLGFANGGDPPVGRVSVVGERGPELFIPKTAGTIVPNSAVNGGKGNVFNISVEGQVDRRTRYQIANDLSLEQRRAQRYA